MSSGRRTSEPPPQSWPPRPLPCDDLVALRPFSDGDVPVLTARFGHPSVTRWFPVPVPVRDEDVAVTLRTYRDRWEAGRQASFAVVHRPTGELAGGIDLDDVDWSRGSGEVGFWLAPEFRGRGLISRAVELLAAWALGPLGLSRLEMMIEPHNTASLAVARRCGFVVEADVPDHDVDWRDQRVRSFRRLVRCGA